MLWNLFRLLWKFSSSQTNFFRNAICCGIWPKLSPTVNLTHFSQNVQNKQNRNHEKAVTHKTMMRLKTWRMTNDGLNNLEYGVREIIKNRLFTKLMIESRLLVPQKISIFEDHSDDPLIHIGTILWTKGFLFSSKAQFRSKIIFF